MTDELELTRCETPEIEDKPKRTVWLYSKEETGSRGHRNIRDRYEKGLSRSRNRFREGLLSLFGRGKRSTKLSWRTLKLSCTNPTWGLR
ncbi:MAG: hypothetical protein U5N26_08160 [Candidatus Marinimicrobia bacterium]|nr:hypothetical protein [Candidatus Neomarinimicrobiota bacterium]